MKQSQKERVFRRLELGDVLTPMTAICMEPPILRLGARINQLRSYGHNIISVHVKRRNGTNSPVCGYVLAKFFDKKRHKRFFDE